MPTGLAGLPSVLIHQEYSPSDPTRAAPLESGKLKSCFLIILSTERHLVSSKMLPTAVKINFQHWVVVFEWKVSMKKSRRAAKLRNIDTPCRAFFTRKSIEKSGAPSLFLSEKIPNKREERRWQRYATGRQPAGGVEAIIGFSTFLRPRKRRCLKFVWRNRQRSLMMSAANVNISKKGISVFFGLCKLVIWKWGLKSDDSSNGETRISIKEAFYFQTHW